MAIDYEKICDEWMEYISSLDLESRKIKFREYLEASGVYDLDCTTTFYLSELNNFLTEGITTLLHDKAQEAKKSGKGLAHYRHTSFALSKPDAMNIVHKYIHKKVLLHSSMTSSSILEMPNTFNWIFLFNIPEYVNNTKLLIESEIPSLPPPRKTNQNIMSKELEETLNYSPNQYGNSEYSPDPFDIDDKQQIIENLKNKIITPTKPLQEQNENIETENNNNNNNDQEYSPDPYDIDENVQKYTPDPIQNNDNNIDNDEPITFGGLKHGTVGHEASATTIISDTGHKSTISIRKLQQLQQIGTSRDSSNYLDSWTKNKTNKNLEPKSSVIIKNIKDDKKEEKIVNTNINTNNSNGVFSPDTPNHKKGDSVIQGGYWKSQIESSDKVLHLLNDGQEHRDQILRAINDINSNINKNIDNNKQINIDEIKTYFNKLNSDNINVIRDIINNKNEIEHKYKMKTITLEEKLNVNNKKSEDKILLFENKIKQLENDIEIKNNLINKQTLNINELEINISHNNNINNIKNDIISEMQLQFNKNRNEMEEKQNKQKLMFDNNKMNDIIDKQDEIFSKLQSINKYNQQIKQQYTFINEGMDNIQNINEKYYNQTVKKMNEYNNKIINNINDIDFSNEQKNNNNNNNNNSNIIVNEMVKVTNLASQLTQDMSSASMLSVLRNEYENIRKEKEEMRHEVERYRQENQILSLKKQQLEEEAIHVRESKRRTIKNLVDEINDMRDQIFKLSKQQIK